MRVDVSRESGEVTQRAADWVADVLSRPRTRNVMVAGGATPLGLYADLARRELDLSHVTIFALDDYVGVPMEDPRTCANVIRRTVVEAWGIPEERYHSLSSLPGDAQRSIERHERLIEQAGGLDLAILGLGRNGHVGFNEPGSAPDSLGRVLPLAPTSVQANREWFGGEYAPSEGVTTGLKTILAARKVLLLALGEVKAAAVRDMLRAAPRPECPASWLQSHGGVSVFLDAGAAGLPQRPADSALATS